MVSTRRRPYTIRGLLRDCENFTDGLFAALLATQQLPTDAIVIRSSLSPSFNHAGRELILNNKSIKILPLSSLNVLNVIPNPQKSGKMNRHIYLEYLELTSRTVDFELHFSSSKKHLNSKPNHIKHILRVLL